MRTLSFFLCIAVIILAACSKGKNVGKYTCTCSLIEKTPPGSQSQSGTYEEIYDAVTNEEASIRCNMVPGNYNGFHGTNMVYNCSLK